MKRKEIKNLAKKVYDQEMIIQNSTDTKVKQLAEIQIMKLIGSVRSVEEMDLLDETVQELINKN